MNLLVVLILSLISILFLLVGTLIIFSTHNNKNVMTFSVSLGFVVLILLGIMHLIPDALEFFKDEFKNSTSYLLLVLFTFLGFIMIFLFDKFGGHHHKHEHEEEKDHSLHISIITCIFLIIHNFIEGMTIYSTILLNYETAVILTLGIGLHNIPLGFTLSSTLNKIYSKTKTLLFIVFIGLSYLLGAIVAYKFNDILTKPLVLGVALTLTFGMILYIAIYEFLPLIKEYKNKKYVLIGYISGLILMLLTIFL